MLLAALTAALAPLAVPAVAGASWNLTVAKATSPSGGTGFGFTVTGPTTVSPISGVDDGGGAERTGLQEGTTDGDDYTVTEVDPGPGWTLTGIACTGAGVDVRSTDLAARSVTLRADLSPGTPDVTCTFTNRMLATGVALEKTGPASAVAGELVTYNLKVTNTGETSFDDGASGENGAVVVTDPLCQAPPKLVARDGDRGDPGTLSPGESWTYQCQVATKAGDTQVDNAATVTARDTAGRTATATGDARTTLSRPGGAVSPVTPSAVTGRARLSGTVGCATARWATATVSGSNIGAVTFYVNDRRVLTLRRPDGSGHYRLRYRVRSLRYGAYAVRANVRFTANATPRTRTLTLQFSRCRPRSVTPTFTG